MLRNYLKITVRNLRRHLSYTFINIFGLAVGMAVCLLILLFVRHEMSYDRFHEKAERTYRVLLASESAGSINVSNNIPENVAPLLHETLPEVEGFVKTTSTYGGALITANGQQRYEDQLMQAGPGFFDVFSFKPIAGNLPSALDEPGSVVLTESAARTYFGDTDPLGQVLTVTGREETSYTVRALIEDVPSTSHLQFNMIIHRPDRDQPRWNYYMVRAYVTLREDADLAAVEAKLPGFVEQNAYYDRPRDTLPSVLLQPIPEIHLNPEWGQARAGMGPVEYLYLFIGVALLILLIACVNFMNLATARSATRAREVGVRKTVGAKRSQLIFQFLSESVLMSVMALLLALVLVLLLLPAFNAIVGQDLDLRTGLGPILLLGGIALIAGLLSGSYPALFLSSFQPVRVLKGRLTGDVSGAGFRKALVVFQFGASVVLILATVVIYNQMQFVRTARLNGHDDQVLIIEQGHILGDRFEPLRQALVANPNIVSAASGTLPGSIDGTNIFTDSLTGAVQTIEFMGVGHDFLQTLGLELTAGRDFVDSDYKGEAGIVIGGTKEEHRRPLIINKTAVAWLGLEEPIGQFAEQLNGTVVGVVDDFHMLPMHEVINPLVMQFVPKESYTVMVRLESGRIAEGLAAVQQTWQQFVPERPLLYSFLDDELDEAYRSELRLGNLFGAFAVLAVIIACLGLFGLAAFTAEQRTKEIGVRKVLGASVPNLVGLLSKDFLVLVAIAFCIAAPVAYFAMQRWLSDFAYHIDLSWSVFLLAGLAALGIALLTVSYQAIKAAVADPVKSLRYE